MKTRQLTFSEDLSVLQPGEKLVIPIPRGRVGMHGQRVHQAFPPCRPQRFVDEWRVKVDQVASAH